MFTLILIMLIAAAICGLIQFGLFIVFLPFAIVGMLWFVAKWTVIICAVVLLWQLLFGKR